MTTLGLAGCTDPPPVATKVEVDLVGVVSLNVCGAACPKEVDNDSWLAAVTSVIDGYKADVVLIQEICRGQFVTLSSLAQRTTGNTYQLAWRSTSIQNESCVKWGEGLPPEEANNYGVAILSRGPIVSRDTWELPSPTGGVTRRMLCVDTVLHSNLARACSVKVDNDQANRRAQLSFVSRLANDWSERLAVIIGGDFGLSPSAQSMTGFYADPLGTGKFLEIDDSDAGHFGTVCGSDADRCRTGAGTLVNSPALKHDYVFMSQADFEPISGGVDSSALIYSDRFPVVGMALLSARRTPVTATPVVSPAPSESEG